MNKMQYDVLLELSKDPKATQRTIANQVNQSLGSVNKIIHQLESDGYFYQQMLTEKAKKLIEKSRPNNAIILAAGAGLGMTPINHQSSKGMLVVNGRTIVENLILQLHEKGVKEIIIVVGFMKEQYEELIDHYAVKLIVNHRYHETNNLYSLYLARKYLHCSYILPCDVWCEENFFSEYEPYSWYMFDSFSSVISPYGFISKSGKLKRKVEENYLPLGVAYLDENDSKIMSETLQQCKESDFMDKTCYWEDKLFDSKSNVYGKLTKKKCYEINTYEDLRKLDPDSISLTSEVIDIISAQLHTKTNKITGFELLKKGMTNRSFTFYANEQRYIMRIPGEGTDKLINRKEEGEVYQCIKSLHISDDVVYFNCDNGYKLTRFLPNARCCDSSNDDDLMICMKLLKNFHQQKLTVKHTFDLYEKIDYYESLRGKKSLYNDYDKTKKKILYLKNILERMPKQWTLTHMDAVYDNFLIYEENGHQYVRLIDWEYAAMQDSDVDIAMFCIYAMYDRSQIDHLINIYYENQCVEINRLKIYCYIAICGLLWSNWCEYKHTLGIEFGEYSLAQYHYAKQYANIVMEKLKEEGK